MANYLPLLLVSVSTNAIPDDTSLSTQARGQVDYLSHEWKEEDVWRSWRNMTRQKNEIVNGPRLENASWRTWWKQRNGLKTISPETLNWLKDSDVTWLYGPLHTALDWSPPPKPQEDPTSVEKDHSAHDRLDLTTGHPLHKPILKHRTIGELLTSALPSTAHDEDELETYDEQDGFVEDTKVDDPVRPPILHTKSDTNVMKWTTQRHRNQFRKDSPPRIIAQQPSSPEAFPAEISKLGANGRSGSSDSARDSSSQDLNSMGRPAKRHITFNTFVEQCIAIDSPPKSKKPSPDGRWAAYEDYDDGSVPFFVFAYGH
ncbi:hypothetical protein OF83DRAFT_1056245 [Amylostereum chailletii]|nr:hypothetical protein OF83DRAFT_1056245 [Amylostereum chailletii]